MGIAWVYYNNIIGLMAGCLFTDIKAAMGILPMLVMPIILFSGFFANSKNFYVWISWIRYVSPVTYTFEGVSTNQFSTKEYDIDPLELYDFDIGIWQCIVIMAAFIIIFRAIGLLFLYKLRQTI